jgi:hypothetical protein
MLDIGTLLVVVSLSQPLAARLRLSPLGLCAMIGMRFPRRADSQIMGESVRLFADLPLVAFSLPTLRLAPP